ncbi:MAG: response regulator [Gammaproteobacteria bacterium]|nr:response regulator [Gammaproteobacteria bacterium]
MTTPILICDDSSFARKQMARALPAGWDVDVSFAENGAEGLEVIRSGKGEIVFLDLNMPVMDGYEVLQTIRSEDLPAMVIVVSGDIQPEAHERVTKLGAMAFVKKPVDAEELGTVLRQFGIELEVAAEPVVKQVDFGVNQFDCYQEVANVAMGQAVDQLARLLKTFVHMPIPKVSSIERGDLRMALEQVDDDDTVSAVCQGFIGSNIAGEALLIFNETSYTDLAELMHYEGDLDESRQLELLMDMACVLIGAFLNGMSEQLDVGFSQGHPVVLGQHVKVRELLGESASNWTTALSIEMGYTIEGRNIQCDLLLLFTEDSTRRLNELVAYMAD